MRATAGTAVNSAVTDVKPRPCHLDAMRGSKVEGDVTACGCVDRLGAVTRLKVVPVSLTDNLCTDLFSLT